MSTNPFKRIEYEYGIEGGHHESRPIYAETELRCYSDGDNGVLEIDTNQRYFSDFDTAKKVYKQMLAISHEMIKKKEDDEKEQRKAAAKRASAKSR